MVTPARGRSRHGTRGPRGIRPSALRQADGTAAADGPAGPGHESPPGGPPVARTL